MSQLIMTVRPLYPAVSLRPLDQPREQISIRVLQAFMGDSSGVGGASRVSFTRSAAQAIGAHRIVRSVSATQVDYASQDDLSHADDVLGLSLNAASTGAQVEVLRDGEIVEPSWSFIALLPIYLGVNGLLTQVPPASGFLLPVGFATSPTSAVIDIGTPIDFN
jgi:hypothetical protein